MKIKVSLLVVVFICIFFTQHNSYSYHFLISPSAGGDYFFRFLPSLPVDFRVDGGTLGGGNGLSMAQSACDEWNSLPNIGDLCGDLNQISTDITSENYNTLVSAFDDINDIVFDEDGSIMSLIGFPGALGIGLTVFENSGGNIGRIIDITVIINGSASNPPLVDLLSTITHEMGHGWGLAHTAIGGISTSNSTPGLDRISPSAIPTMYPFNIPLNDALGRSLETDDLAAILVLYRD